MAGAPGPQRDQAIEACRALLAREPGLLDELMPKILRWTDEVDEDAQLASMTASLMRDDPRLGKALLRELKSKSAVTRRRAAGALANYPYEPAEPQLFRALKDPAARVRFEALRALVLQGKKSLAPRLRKVCAAATKDESRLVREAAEDFLLRFLGDDA